MPASQFLLFNPINGALTVWDPGEGAAGFRDLGRLDLKITAQPLIGDLNGDGHDDVYLRPDGWLDLSGQSYTMHGVPPLGPLIERLEVTVDAFGIVQTTLTTYRDLGEPLFVGDVENGSEAELVVITASGLLALNSVTSTGGRTTFAPLPSASWRPIAVADLVGDAKGDVVTMNMATRQLTAFNFTESTPGYSGGINLLRLEEDWALTFSGDFNGDGRDELLFQNVMTGAVVSWDVAGGADGFTNQPAVSENWHILGTGDLNADGREDIVMGSYLERRAVAWTGMDFIDVSPIIAGGLQLLGIGHFG